MINFEFETDFVLKDEVRLSDWISAIILSEGFELGEVSYIFCDDEFLYNLNVEFLGHETLTDILSFDYRIGQEINGEIFISVERVAENAVDFNVSFEKELHRVMIHGILHYCGYKDKTSSEESIMRHKEDQALLRLGFDYI